MTSKKRAQPEGPESFTTQINWILEYVSDIGHQGAMKGLDHARVFTVVAMVDSIPEECSELLRHRMNLGALKSVANDSESQYAVPFNTVVQLLQEIGHAISRRERREYMDLLLTSQAYAAVQVSDNNITKCTQELDETQDTEKFLQTINDIFQDEDACATRDEFLVLLKKKAPRYQRPDVNPVTLESLCCTAHVVEIAAATHPHIGKYPTPDIPQQGCAAESIPDVAAQAYHQHAQQNLANEVRKAATKRAKARQTPPKEPSEARQSIIPEHHDKQELKELNR